ncbi:MAG: ATP-dependent zinc metalloprotease FtsH [Opitutales bacterium]|nr:ATP-dependent zinc metalloprotease FtsH [Opitutales bacterium]
MWGAIIAVLVGLLIYTPGGKTTSREITIAQVLEFAKQKSISSITLKNNPVGGAKNYYTITGELHTVPAATGTTQAGQPNAVSPVQNLAKFNASGTLLEDDIKLLRDSVPAQSFKDTPAGSRMGDLIWAILPSLIIGGIILFLIFRSIRRAQSQQFLFGRSRAKLLDKEKSKVSFKDVAGCDEAKEEVSEVVDFLREPKRFSEIGGRIPKGVLLVGPPGTGKTLLARAVAGEADVPFFSISGSDFVELYVGVGASRVRDTFEQARKNAPCIIFIDEIDAVGRQRGSGLGGGNDEREQTLNSLLVEMDGFAPQEGVIVIAATNRADVLDAALLRPGRFDRQVYVDLPDLKGREAILRVHAKKFKISEKVDLAYVAKTTTGFAGADLANLLNEAALVAVRAKKTEIDMISVEEARDKISYGRERRRVMDDKDRATTAYHEAGHALVQVAIDDGTMPLHKVTIIPRGGALGMAMFMPSKDILGRTKTQLLNTICSTMAGRIGEKVFTHDISSGASSDIKSATSMARRMVCEWGMSSLGPVAFGENQQNLFLGREIARTQNISEATLQNIDREIRDIIDSQYERAEKIISENAEAHKKIAEALLEYETLDGVHVKEILEHGEIRTSVEYKPLSAVKDDAEEEKESENKPETVPAPEQTEAPSAEPTPEPKP